MGHRRASVGLVRPSHPEHALTPGCGAFVALTASRWDLGAAGAGDASREASRISTNSPDHDPVLAERAEDKLRARLEAADERCLHLEAALARAKEAADSANRELESLSHSVAHDLRAPLRGIDGFSQALLEEYAERLDDDGRRYLGHVRASAQHMMQLLESLLGLSRVSRGELQRERVDLSELGRAAAARLRTTQPERTAEISIADGLVCQGDARLLGVVVESLLGNAWKFSRNRQLARIELGSELAPGGPAFFVRDNGAGFDVRYASKLFGAFQRLHSPSEFEGTGMGLATVQRIIARHGGRIWAEGAVDQGATFHFTLEESRERS